MCLIFLAINRNSTGSQPRLVIAHNRDEFYSRPCSSATWWEECTGPRIFGGMDMTEGRRGGTWLAMSKNGKIGALLNFTNPNPDLSAPGRGSLIPRFLRSTAGPLEFCEVLQETAKSHNGFTFLGLSINGEEVDSCGLCLDNDKNIHEIENLSDGIHVFGNGLPGKPWRKLQCGQKAFQAALIKSFAKSPKDCAENLLRMLSSTENCWPDDVLLNQASEYGEEKLKNLCQTFVQMPGYGTRAQTVIYVAADGHTTFIERSLVDFNHPRDENSWKTETFEFDLE